MDEWAKSANKETPIFVGHGSADPVVQYDYGKSSADLLKSKNYKVQFESYRGMQHSACNQELDDMKEFLKQRL
jgi:predicted esterase